MNHLNLMAAITRWWRSGCRLGGRSRSEWEPGWQVLQGKRRAGTAHAHLNRGLPFWLGVAVYAILKTKKVLLLD